MRIKVNDEDRRNISRALREYISIEKYEHELLDKFSSIIMENIDGSVLEIINDYYLDEDDFNNSNE